MFIFIFMPITNSKFLILHQSIVRGFRVQRGIITLFSRKPLEGQTLISLNGVIKSVLKQDIGEFIVPFYEVG